MTTLSPPSGARRGKRPSEVGEISPVFEAYMSPGSVSEKQSAALRVPFAR